MPYKIGHVARVARVSVRALHHYDEIGLIRPSGRSGSGYRLYTDLDLERLQQVLFFRELGFPLEEILRILADPSFDRRSALLAQRARLAENAERASALVRLIDRTIESIREVESMKPEEMFDGFNPARYEEEAKARWGNTSAHAESLRRTKLYSPEDWKTIRAEADGLTDTFAEAMTAGIPPCDGRAMDVAERHRAHIGRWFYPCPAPMHAGLGEVYVGDARFASMYENRKAGLAEYMRDAIVANASRVEEARADEG